MADSGFQLVLNAVAQVVGGTVSTVDSHFYSGDLVGDGTGVAGIKGCWSVKPDDIGSTPVGVIVPDSFDEQLLTQGERPVVDWAVLVLYVARFDAKGQGALLNSLRDLVPDAFNTHKQAFGQVNVAADVASGRTTVRQFGGITYLAWDFRIRLDRMLHPVYTA